MRKKIFLSAAILAAAVSAYAQGNGQAGITEATNLITGYFDPLLFLFPHNHYSFLVRGNYNVLPVLR